MEGDLALFEYYMTPSSYNQEDHKRNSGVLKAMFRSRSIHPAPGSHSHYRGVGPESASQQLDT